MKKNCLSKGFTLIEVVIALTIFSWVLGSVLFLVSQYADERLMMRERFYGNQVAWNQLMNNYQKSKGWISAIQSTEVELNGREQQGGQNWDWQLEVAPAMGRSLFRYQSRVSSESDIDVESILTMYLLNTQNGQGGIVVESNVNP
jgi:type II secretion system protein I